MKAALQALCIVLAVENSYFRSYVGVAIGTAYTPVGQPSPKTATVRGSRFDPLDVPAARYPPAAISMNYGMAPGDGSVPDDQTRSVGYRLR
jgi:hypothetical protein